MDKFLTHAHTSSKAQLLMGETTPLATTEGTSATQWLPKTALLEEDSSVGNNYVSAAPVVRGIINYQLPIIMSCYISSV